MGGERVGIAAGMEDNHSGSKLNTELEGCIGVWGTRELEGKTGFCEVLLGG